MIQLKQEFRRLAQSRLGSRIFVTGPYRAANVSMRRRMPRLALRFAYVAHAANPSDHRVLWLMVQASARIGDRSREDRFRALRIKKLLPAHIERGNLTSVLKLMAELERTMMPAQFSAGKMIADQLISKEGRHKLLRSVNLARKRFRSSAFLIHLETLCQAMEGEVRTANETLTKELDRPFMADDPLETRRFDILRGSWQVVDLIARQEMEWADGGADGYQKLFSTLPPAPKANDANETAAATARLLGFKEHALQGRMRPEYLAACDADLTAARTADDRLKAIRAMLRPGIRHIPDYGPSYELARRRLIENLSAFEPLFTDVSTGSGVIDQSVLDLCNLLNLSRRLELPRLARRCLDRLVVLSENKANCHALWPAPSEIIKEPGDKGAADLIMGRVRRNKPKISRDLQHYFRYAMISGRYEEANEFFATLPKRMLRMHGLLYYVNILQRQCRFKEALKLVRSIHSQHLANPARVNAVSNHSLINRIGELEFLIRTEKIFKSVKQPRNPVGIVFVAPRNVDQLRRYPLMVLVTLKKRGWQIVPIVEGLLPKEITGDHDIDLLNGAITHNARLSCAAQAVFPDVEDWDADPSQGHLRAEGIDLGHALWEDAAINRRRYNINYSCPEMQNYLGGLLDWTRAALRCLKYAHGLLLKRKRRMAWIALFTFRLPDAVFRFYCNRYGDPEDFFCLHAANGYQNYFTNFSTNVSRRFVLRNMTRYPHVRSASFPLPENFEHYYLSRRARADVILKRFAGVTKITRSTAGNRNRSVDASLVLERVLAWREDGGRVACAFGKVPCDSGVPHDGGPAHKSMKDWINHCVSSVRGSNTLLLIKPHPHEINNLIATFPTEYFRDLIELPLGDNAIYLGHRWFDMHDMQSLMDLGLVYNGTTTIELGLMGIPCVLAGHFAPIDYPIGHVIPKDRADFEAYVRFEKPALVARDIRERAAVWLDYMTTDNFTVPYRYHVRPVTNRVMYPPWWFEDDLDKFERHGDRALTTLAERLEGIGVEPYA